MMENMAGYRIRALEAEMIISLTKKEYETALKKYNAFKKWRETKNIPTRPKHQS
jgi:hypothetical protein